VRARLHELLGLTSRLSEPLSAEEVRRVVVDQAHTHVGALTTLMWAVDDPPTHATLVRDVGPNEARYPRIPLESWLPMGDAMLRCEPLFFESRAEFRERYPIAEKQGATGDPYDNLSFACLPLVVQGRAIGGVAIVFNQPRVFDADVRMFLTVFAHHAAQALERAALLEREKQARERLASLEHLASALSSAATVEEIATLAARIGTETLGILGTALWTTGDGGNLSLLANYGMGDELLAAFRHIPISSELAAARVARDRRPRWCESAGDEEVEPQSIREVRRRHEGFRAYAALPLVRNDGVLGVLAFVAVRPRRFTQDERAFMSTVAEHCADAIARARLYEDARSAQRQLKAILERLPIGVVVARPPDSTLVFTNAAAAGYDAEIASGPLGRALNGEVVDALEVRAPRTDGTEGWMHVSAAPVLRDDGTVEVAVATFVDITAERSALRAKDEFLAMLGHELRNPLTPIVTSLDVMRLRRIDVFAAERAIIERQVRHMTRLVDDLLDVSRAARNDLRLERKPVELSAIVCNAIEVASPLIEERMQKLTVDVPRSGLVVDADRGRLTQVVTNLLGNAAKYTPPHGHIAVTARAVDDRIELEVADDGAGIAPELLSKVFDPFTQGPQGLDRKQGGLGLGLAIARRLISGHDGTIEAKSAGPGRGTVIVVRLPRSEKPASAPSTRAMPSAAPRRAPRRLLIADDNPDIVSATIAALIEEGYEVRGAADGPSTLRLVETYVPEIAFLDIGLPVMDGYELAKLLRKIPSLAQTKLVAITGYAQEGDRERALASGFVEHLSKPFDLDELLACLDRFEA
jgi:signal transduction histidine kinase